LPSGRREGGGEEIPRSEFLVALSIACCWDTLLLREVNQVDGCSTGIEDVEETNPCMSDLFICVVLSLLVCNIEVDMISWRLEEIPVGPREIVSSTLLDCREEGFVFDSNVGTPSMLIRIPDISMWEDDD
jgi:hypothetical protein